MADLSDLAGRGVFARWLDATDFERVSIGESGDLVGPSGIEMCPDALDLRVTGLKPEDVFPSPQGHRVA